MKTAATRSILVVDDDPDFAEYLKIVLEDRGFAVETATNGQRALDRVRAAPPDLITLDIQMPGKTGILFYRHMKTDDELRSIPVVVISGFLHESDAAFMERFFPARVPMADAFIAKPVTPQALLAKVNELLSCTSSRSAARASKDHGLTG